VLPIRGQQMRMRIHSGHHTSLDNVN